MLIRKKAGMNKVWNLSKEELQEDILNLQKAGLVESQLSQKLQSKKMKRSSSSTISLYSAEGVLK